MKSTLTLPRPRIAKLSDDALVTGEALAASTSPAEPALSLSSTRLLQGRKSVQIEHNGALYQLRATKFGKLILTK